MKGAPTFDLALSILREAIMTADLLPAAYAHYRPLLADGLCMFLRHLSARRLHSIFAEQNRLPPASAVPARIVALLRHSPALHKLGQVVAHDRRLNLEFRKRLQELESTEPRTPVATMQRLFAGELKAWKKAGIELGPEVLAEGSVAVIVPFTWRESATRGRHEGVFKLLKPGVEKLLEEDLASLGRLGDFLDDDCRRYHLPELDYRDTFDTVRELLLHEVRLDEEQRHLAEATEFYAPANSVVVPALLPFCSARMTAMQRLHGQKISDPGLPRTLSRPGLARTAAEALIAQPLFGSRPAALFHADPHAGNLLATADGRLGILDWSLTGRLRKGERTDLMQLMLGTLSWDVEKMARAVMSLAQKPPDEAAVASVLHSSLGELRQGSFPGVAWLTRLLDALAVRAQVRFGSDLLLFRKSLLTLEGVLADLMQTEAAGCAVFDEAVMRTFVERWGAEWLERFRAPFSSRHFGTHVSNADLFWFLWSRPMALTRWCWEREPHL